MNLKEKQNGYYKRFYEAVVNKPEFEKVLQKNEDVRIMKNIIIELKTLEE